MGRRESAHRACSVSAGFDRHEHHGARRHLRTRPSAAGLAVAGVPVRASGAQVSAAPQLCRRASRPACGSAPARARHPHGRGRLELWPAQGPGRSTVRRARVRHAGRARQPRPAACRQLCDAVRRVAGRGARRGCRGRDDAAPAQARARHHRRQGAHPSCALRGAPRRGARRSRRPRWSPAHAHLGRRRARKPPRNAADRHCRRRHRAGRSLPARLHLGHHRATQGHGAFSPRRARDGGHLCRAPA